MSDLEKIELRLIELTQAIDDLRRALADQQRQTPISYGDTSDANWYWNFG